MGRRPVRPFHEANAMAGKIFVQTRFKILFWKFEAIKIKVI